MTDFTDVYWLFSHIYRFKYKLITIFTKNHWKFTAFFNKKIVSLVCVNILKLHKQIPYILVLCLWVKLQPCKWSMLNVLMLNVVMLSVVAPFFQPNGDISFGQFNIKGRPKSKQSEQHCKVRPPLCLLNVATILLSTFQVFHSWVGLPVIIILAWQGLQGTNTLAYLANSLKNSVREFQNLVGKSLLLRTHTFKLIC